MASILFWNCCGGIASKIIQVKMIIAKYKPELFFISESEVTGINQSWFRIDGYLLTTSPTLEHGKSRIICYQLLGSKLKHVPELLTNDLTECIVFETDDIRIIGAYRPFRLIGNQTKTKALQDFTETIRALLRPKHSRQKVWLGGDLNINLKIASVETTALEEIIDEFGVINLVTSNTWRRIITTKDGSKILRTSQIDHILSNTKLATVKIDDAWTSDHNLLVLEIPKLGKIVRKKHETRSWRKYSTMDLQSIVHGKASLVNIENYDSADKLNAIVTEIMLTSFNELCPIRIARTSKDSYIVNDEIERVKKRRKRKMKEYNRTKNPELLQTIKDLDAKLKKKIRDTGKMLIRKKLESKNKNAFWDTVKQLQGDKLTKDDMSLIIDGKCIMDPCSIANEFASFFSTKVEKLSSNMGPYQWARRGNNILISEKDLEVAIKNIKSKMCTGHDGLPLKIVKNSAPAMQGIILQLMRMSAKSIPISWKTAIVTPIHKSGNKTSVTNYRPIANLVSISKIFERIVLQKIEDQCPDIEGQNQHGFRKQRSTITALLEIQHSISQALDRNKHVSTYSIDMSAAFDLLRPHIFHLKADIDPSLMDLLLDFMTGRVIQVKTGKALSMEKPLVVGCVQGSILGPKLFSIYCNQLQFAIPTSSTLISYADDSYVITTADSKTELKSKTEDSIKRHVEFLSSIGMVVNASKTELLYSTRERDKNFCIEHDESTITASESIKALGMFITRDLSWSKHVNYTLAKSANLVRRIHFLAKWLNTKELLRLVTTQYHPVIFYGSPLWIGCLDAKSWKRINSGHYRAIRAALKDYKKRKRSLVDADAKRATPAEWSRYTMASTVIKLFNSSDTNIAKAIRESSYINDRLPRKAKFMDHSRLKVGRQSIYNRIGSILNKISFDWIIEMSDDVLRRQLKKEFFSYIASK
jgi:hypothetical protein